MGGGEGNAVVSAEEGHGVIGDAVQDGTLGGTP